MESENDRGSLLPNQIADIPALIAAILVGQHNRACARLAMKLAIRALACERHLIKRCEARFTDAKLSLQKMLEKIDLLSGRDFQRMVEPEPVRAVCDFCIPIRPGRQDVLIDVRPDLERQILERPGGRPDKGASQGLVLPPVLWPIAGGRTLGRVPGQLSVEALRRPGFKRNDQIGNLEGRPRTTTMIRLTALQDMCFASFQIPGNETDLPISDKLEMGLATDPDFRRRLLRTGQ